MAQAMHVPYGAYELKRNYQKNMFLGTGFSAGLTLLCILGVWLYSVVTYEDIGDARNIIRIKTIAELGAPPSLAAKPPQIDIAKPQMAAPKVGIPTPVADEEAVDENAVMATQDELQDINAPTLAPTDGSDQQLVIDIPEDDYMPSPDQFVPVETNPEQIYEEPGEFPRLAREGGFTASVIIQAFVDKTGTVKKAQAIKCTRPGMGFEEAAVKAAYKCKYRPAIQNGNPIGVWISYKYDFVIGD